MSYSVVDERGKLYAIAPTAYEAWKIMTELIEYSEDGNWNGLHVVTCDDEVDEIFYM